MTPTERLRAAYQAFIGTSATTVGPPPRSVETIFADVPRGPNGESTRNESTRTRSARKRRLSPIMVSNARWLRADIESAMHSANGGNLRHAAQISDWVKDDLIVGGLAATRCSFPRLERIWQGDDCVRKWFEGDSKTPGVFDEFFPPDELEELAVDHLIAGWGVAPFVKLEGREFPQLTRIDNQWTIYQAGQNRYTYQAWGETLVITPGDGIWVFHGDGQDPWHRGIWKGLGFDQVSEDQAGLNRDAFISKYSNPFIVAKAAQGLSDDQKFMGWGALRKWTMGFLGSVGAFDIQILQPKAEGREVISDAEAKVERRAMMRIAGQVVTSLGGPGFANAEIFAIIASFLVTRSAQSLCRTLNAQAIPQIIKWAQAMGYLPAGNLRATLSYNTTPPQARKADADAIKAAMDAFAAQVAASKLVNDPRLMPNVLEYINRYSLPATAVVETEAASPALPPAPTVAGPIAKEDPVEPDEPGYSESLAANMTAMGFAECPHGEDRVCRSCRVVRRYEAQPDRTYKPVWHAYAKAAP